MADTRKPYFSISTGIKDIGKSYTNFKMAYLYSKGISGGNFYPRKVLIFDSNNEYGSFEVNPEDEEGMQLIGSKPILTDALDIYDVPYFTAQPLAEIRRIAPIHLRNIKDKKGNIIARVGDRWDDNEALGYLSYTIKTFRGGLLWIEDASSLFGDSIPDKIKAVITRNRHLDLEIVMDLQSIAPILPRLWQNCEWTRFHFQSDDVASSKDKLEDKFPMYKIAERLVWEQYFNGNIRYYVWVNNPEKYITGAITKEMAIDAIHDYLSENMGEMRGLTNKRDGSGIKVNNYQTALNQRTEHLYNLYFRNLKQ
jgi:hypothetical protein